MTYVGRALVLCLVFICIDTNASEPTRNSFEGLAPFAGGLCLGKVVSTSIRTGRGELSVPHHPVTSRTVVIDIERSTGDVSKEFQIMIEWTRQFHDLPLDHSNIKVVPKVGESYWFAFRSYYTNLPFIYDIWPVDKEPENSICNKLLMEDGLKWKPIYNPTYNLILEHFAKSDKEWTVRVKCYGRVLWEKFIAGKNYEMTRVFDPVNTGFGPPNGPLVREDLMCVFNPGGPPAPTDDAMCSPGGLVSVQTVISLASENRFKIPDGKYVITYDYEGFSGKIRRARFNEHRDMGNTSNYLILDLEYEPSHGNLVRRNQYKVRKLSELEYERKREMTRYDPVSGNTVERKLFLFGKETSDGLSDWIEQK